MEWNVVATIHRNFPQALGLLRRFGHVHKTGFFNVLVLQVPAVREFLDRLHEAARQQPDDFACLSHIIPISQRFQFSSPEEFQSKARVIALEYVPALAGKAFHVRMHRRGFKGRIQRTQEEQLLDRALRESLAERGMTARIDFEDPDAILAVETVGDQAGMSLWLRIDLQRYPFLRQSFGLEPVPGSDTSCPEK